MKSLFLFKILDFVFLERFQSDSIDFQKSFPVNPDFLFKLWFH